METEEQAPLDEVPSPPGAAVPWYERPLWLGLVGLALMVGGWKLSTYVPEGADVPEKVRELEQQTEDEALRQRLRQFYGKPPYQVPGRLIFVAGLLVFLYAGVRMAGGQGRNPSPRPPPPRGEGE
jgi:hypothetical protein